MGRTVKWYCPFPLQTGNFNFGMCPLTTFICITTQPDFLLPPILLPEHFISCTVKIYFTKHAFVFYSYNITGELALLFFPGRLPIVLNADCEISGWGGGIGLFLGVPSTGAWVLPFYERWPRLNFHMSPHNGLWQRKTRFFPSFSFYFQLNIYSTHIV